MLIYAIFKVVDIGAKSNVKPIRCLEEDYVRMPYWLNKDKPDITIQVKANFVNTQGELCRGCNYAINLECGYYHIEDLEGGKSTKW